MARNHCPSLLIKETEGELMGMTATARQMGNHALKQIHSSPHLVWKRLTTTFRIPIEAAVPRCIHYKRLSRWKDKKRC